MEERPGQMSTGIGQKDHFWFFNKQGRGGHEHGSRAGRAFYGYGEP